MSIIQFSLHDISYFLRDFKEFKRTKSAFSLSHDEQFKSMSLPKEKRNQRTTLHQVVELRCDNGIYLTTNVKAEINTPYANGCNPLSDEYHIENTTRLLEDNALPVAIPIEWIEQALKDNKEYFTLSFEDKVVRFVQNSIV